MARLTLAQQLALLDDPAPQDIDPEDASRPLNGGGAEHTDPGSDDGDEAPDGKEHYLEVGRSALRGLDPELENPRYAGVKLDRMKIFDDDEDEEEDEFRGVGSDVDDTPHEGDSGDDEEGADEDEDDDDDDDDDEAEDPEGEDEATPPAPRLPPVPAQSPSPPPPPIQPTSDAQKALAVTQQLSALDTLLSTRIALQKLVTTSNKLPLPGKIGAYAESEEGGKALREFMREAEKFSDDLFELREGLLKINEKVALPDRPLKRKRPAQDEDDDVDMDEFVKQATHHHSLLTAAAHPPALQTLHKWSQKILAVHPTLLAPSTAPSSHTNGKSGTSRFSAHRNQPPKDVVQVIDEVLRSTQDKLRERSRARDVRPLGEDGDGEAAGEEAAKETFDDAEFYGSLLREVIDSRRASAAATSALDDLLPSSRKGKQKSKKKKEVDTKASKGRKLRFEVHEKMQHFMFPKMVQTGWGEAQIDELFGSLLGRGMGTGVAHGERTDGVEGEIEVGQLRVFG